VTLQQKTRHASTTTALQATRHAPTIAAPHVLGSEFQVLDLVSVLKRTRFSYRRPMLKDDGGPNRRFLNYLFCDQFFAIAFLKDVDLLRSTMLFNTFGRDMTWSAASSTSEGFRWWCNRRAAGVRCNQSASIKQGSWFQLINLTLQEILLITYDTVCCDKPTKIQSEYRLSSHTIADWGMICREIMLVFLEGCSVKIGGPNDRRN